MGFMQEVDALQRWVWGVAGLPSMRLSASPPTVARPVILWEAPGRSRDRFLGRYRFVNRVRAYGRLYVTDLAQLVDYQERLQLDLENRLGVLDVYDQEGAQGRKVGTIKDVAIEFTESNTLDVPFVVTYEATYKLTQPTRPPAPRFVYQRSHYK